MGNSICWFNSLGSSPDNFASKYANNQYDFDVTILYTTYGINWNCWTGNNKGFKWFDRDLYGGYRCWEGSVCYDKLISQKGSNSNIKSCNCLWGVANCS